MRARYVLQWLPSVLPSYAGLPEATLGFGIMFYSLGFRISVWSLQFSVRFGTSGWGLGGESLGFKM